MMQNGGYICRRGRSLLGIIGISALFVTALVAGASAVTRPPGTAQPRNWPKTASPAALVDPASEARITTLMAGLSIEEKVAQTIQADIGSISPKDLARYPLGALLAGGNSAPGGNNLASPAEWVALARTYREAARRYWQSRPALLPLFGIDAVHGHQKVRGATIFPHNIGLGATHDPGLVQRIAAATALEAAVTGIDWTFAPTLAVPRDHRWGRTYEGFAQTPEAVAAFAGAAVRGLQGVLVAGEPLAAGHVVATAKHFLGDGGTENGRDQGDTMLSERALAEIHAAGYKPAIEAGVLTVMASFSSWNGVKMHANESLLTGVLKERMSFQGFVIGDWNAHGQVPGCTNERCPDALNAGLDMYMAPDSWHKLLKNTVQQVKSGVIPMARLDDAVRRILRVKMKAGLFAETRPLEGKIERLGAPAHRALAREAVRQSLVLLKNEGVLPIKANAHVLVTGDGASNIPKQCGGWSLSWQGAGTRNADFPGAQSIYAGLREALKAGGGTVEFSGDGSFKARPDVAIVVYGEEPYAEFQGDLPSLHYKPGDDRDLDMLRALEAQKIPIVSVFLSGRPLWVNRELNASDAFVAAWLPGSEGGGVADLLIGDEAGRPRHDFSGRLGFVWPGHPELSAAEAPLFGLGYGLSYTRPQAVGLLSEDPGNIALATSDVLFARGRVQAQYRLLLRDSEGERAASGAGTESPGGVIALRSVDAGAQEAAREISWSGRGAGTLAFNGTPRSLSRAARSGMALALRLRLDEPPTAPVELGMGCAEDYAGFIDVSDRLRGAGVGGWHVLAIKLSAFRAAGTDMSCITEPLILRTEGRLRLTIDDIRLTQGE